jgi:ketosteroid isomerase-like protein
MIAAGGGVEKNDMSDLRVQILASGDVAVTTYFVDNRTRSADGEVESIRAFETDVWQKIDGAWKVVSLHYSLLLPE